MEKKIPGKLHIKINELLQKKEITRSQLCKEIRVSPASLERYCNGSIKMMDAEILCKLCDYFDVEVGDLIEYQPK